MRLIRKRRGKRAELHMERGVNYFPVFSPSHPIPQVYLEIIMMCYLEWLIRPLQCIGVWGRVSAPQVVSGRRLRYITTRFFILHLETSSGCESAGFQ